MGKIKTIYLEKLLSDNNFLLGRDFAKSYVKDIDLLGKIKSEYEIHIEIGDKIKSVNDSFWKGFFNGICKEYRTPEILEMFSFSGDDQIIEVLIENLNIIDAIHHKF